MIMPDDDIVCVDSSQWGYTALYNVCEDSELAAGVVIAAVMQGVLYLFQLDETTDILNESSVSVMEHTLFEYLEEELLEDITYFPITNCRFPTEKELKWYNSLKMI